MLKENKYVQKSNLIPLLMLMIMKLKKRLMEILVINGYKETSWIIIQIIVFNKNNLNLKKIQI